MIDDWMDVRGQYHRTPKYLRPVPIALLSGESGESLKANGNVLRVVSLPASWTSVLPEHSRFEGSVVLL